MQVGVGVLVLQDGLVLLGRRRVAPGAGSWAVPGGEMAFGDEIEATAARVLKAQAGLTAGILELGPYTNDVLEAAGRHLVTIFGVARGIRGVPANLAPDQCEGWAWFRWGAWPAPLFAPMVSLLAIGWRPGGA